MGVATICVETCESLDAYGVILAVSNRTASNQSRTHTQQNNPKGETWTSSQTLRTSGTHQHSRVDDDHSTPAQPGRPICKHS